VRTHVTIHSTGHTVTVPRADVALISDDPKKQRAIVRNGRELSTHPLTLAEYNRLQVELTGKSDAGE
jgi:hypothetical protein